MANPKVRRFIAGAGWVLVAACTCAIGLRYGGGSWAIHHSFLLNAVIIISLVGAIVVAAIYFAMREPHTPQIKQSNYVGRDNNGIQITDSVLGDEALDKILKATPNRATPSRLYIHSAEYVSVDDPWRFVSVAECLRRLIVEDRLVLEVQNHNFVAEGRNYVRKDIHPNHRKKLCVTYSFNNGPLQTIAVIEEAILRLPEPHPKTALPILSLDFSGGNIQIYDEMVDFSDSGREQCYSIRVHNRRAAEGEEAYRADSVSAGITFAFAESSRMISVDRSCWIGEIANEIYLHPGDTKHVLMGIIRGNEWITYDNPNRIASSGWPSRDQPLREIKFSLFGNAKITGEISLIAHRNNKAITLFVRKFVIAVGESNVSINIRWLE